MPAEGYCAGGKIIPAQVLAVLQGKGLERKEAFLLTAVLATFAASKVTALPRQLSRPMLSAKTTYFRYPNKRKAQFVVA
ncbi:hypothetical protein [Mucilaginibacter dorajii]|uniref:hypothetical protein n=1 Tax=Mucilaginibacter dorajii TaxID=692994 RepID=UPI002166C994|nr:hypothetical protein [Mucilaginibacter dorajii]MCS3737012.1 hypothetical protein [Mucilaginibacter dorajii]